MRGRVHFLTDDEWTCPFCSHAHACGRHRNNYALDILVGTLNMLRLRPATEFYDGGVCEGAGVEVADALKHSESLIP
jgi:hypothetical protein